MVEERDSPPVDRVTATLTHDHDQLVGRILATLFQAGFPSLQLLLRRVTVRVQADAAALPWSRRHPALLCQHHEHSHHHQEDGNPHRSESSESRLHAHTHKHTDHASDTRPMDRSVISSGCFIRESRPQDPLPCLSPKTQSAHVSDFPAWMQQGASRSATHEHQSA